MAKRAKISSPDQRWEFNYASVSAGTLFAKLKTGEKGLSESEAAARLKIFGPNDTQEARRPPAVIEFLKKFASPLILLLLAIAVFSFFFGDKISTVVVMGMVLLSVTMSFYQERKADGAARKLQEMVQSSCTVVRGGSVREIPLKKIVPGDIVTLSAGEMIPGDIRIIDSKDLFINQAALTGESYPVEKSAKVLAAACAPLQLCNLAFMGSSVVSGIGRGVVVHTGRATTFGKIAAQLSEKRGETLFETQMKDFTMLMIRVTVLVVAVLVAIYTLRGRDSLDSFLFALAVAVQITPETLPMIVTVNLARGARAMARKKTIVKRLNCIQNLGAMDILCSDKTGTLTQNEIVLQKYINVAGVKDEGVFMYGYINSFYQTGLKNLLDTAILKHKREDLHACVKIDEVPFDFQRKIKSVVIKNKKTILISVGAAEELVARCTKYETVDGIKPLEADRQGRILEKYYVLSSQGYRVLAVAYKVIGKNQSGYEVVDEQKLILKGYMAFLDPPKPSAKMAISELREAGIEFKIVTGDNKFVTEKICAEVGIKVEGVVLGSQIGKMSDFELAQSAELANIFADVTPEQKKRVIKCLRSNGHTVGYMGDGINDAASLSAADIGISVNNGVDIAKECAGIVLLEKDLRVLADGVLEGRKVFGNFMKYIHMTGMVNVGYMISTTAASVVLPFLPMNPVQMLLNNYLYEVYQTAIPSDNVGPEYLKKPRKWHISSVIKFMLMLGAVISVFDFVTFAVLWFVFGGSVNPLIFQTGWFLETMLAQALVIYAIRSRKAPFRQSVPGKFLMAMSAIIILVAFTLPYTPLAVLFHLAVVPPMYYFALVNIVLVFLATVWAVKNWFMERLEND